MKYEEFEARAKSAFDDCSEMKRMLWNMQGVAAAVQAMVRKNERLDRERAELKAEIERLKSEVPDDCMRLPLDADGVPIEVGDEVYFFDEKANEPVVGYGPFRVIGFDAEEGAVKLRYEEGGTDHYGNYSEEFEPAETLTHRKPDSWEQLEDDSLLSVDEYRNLTGIDCNEGAYFAKQRDLIRRAKRLAGVNDDQ